MTTLALHPLREHPPLEPTVVSFVHDGEAHAWPWISGTGGALFYRQGIDRAFSWGEVVDQHIDWAMDPDMDDTMPEGWVRLIPETTNTKEAS
ncbi:hypothetical protein MRBLMI12_000469 [Microbacterium sp. LMI12-1-1.1]|uniref:hypothetical protein n=1 Tax=Microbacterium sp. LMI12-1-1.1 TaxID=3135225 RepID=UPI00341D6389